MKKLLTFILSAVMALAMSVSVCAATPATDTGSITVSNPLKGQTYNIYRVFDLESYDSTAGAYAYKLNSDFEGFATRSDIRGTYIALENKGTTTYVTWIDGADAKEFAKLALAYATADATKVNPVAAATADDTDSPAAITFSNLPLGYYLLDSSAGALCSLDTTQPSATINEKNTLTTVAKKVKEDSTANWDTSNSAQIGQVVEYKSDIKVGDGVQNLTLHDTMDESLTLDTTSFEVKVNDQTVAASNYTVKTGAAVTDGHTFDIIFNDTYTSGLAKDTVIQVLYKATLNEKAKFTTDSNTNTAKVTFGDNNESTSSTTKTNTYQFDLAKTDVNGKILNGAEFNLYDAATGGNVISLVAESEDEDNGVYVYRVAAAGDTTTTTTIKAGKTTIKGLDADTYYLEETKAPDGYNKLASRVEVALGNGNILLTKTFATAKVVGETITTNDGGVQVINNTGKVLPSTGGMGTTIFYLLGAVLVIMAVILLAVRRLFGRNTRRIRRR